MAFVEIDPKDLKEDVCRLFGEEWALLSAGNAQDCNTMTIGWGGIGTMWGAPSVSVYVRETRYTREYMEREDLFTLSFFGGDCRKALGFCGSKSGRDCDKIAESGLVAVDLGGSVAFEGARLVLVCRKQFKQFMPAENFIDKEALTKWYADENADNYHYLYIGCIEAAYVAE